MFINKLLVILLLASIATINAEDFEKYSTNSNFNFYRQKNEDYTEYIREFTESYLELVELFNLEDEYKIDVYIFSTQTKFIENVYGYYDKKAKFHGMAKRGENTIYITSYYDTTHGLDSSDFFKIVKHELVHTLLEDKNDRRWLSEGLAIYCAKQEFDYKMSPKNIENMNEYLSNNYTFIEAYEYYAWFTKYLIEKIGLKRYLNFYKSDYDWSIMGYSNQLEFCKEAYEEFIKR